MKIKRSWVIPLVIALLIVGATGYWGYGQYREKQQLEIYMGNKYQQAFYDLVEHVEQLQVLLDKSLVSTSSRKNILILTDVWSHANTAQAELNKLPLAAQTVYKTAKFLSQTGDYAHVMAQQNAEGKLLSEENRKKLSELREHATEIGNTLQNVQQKAFAGDINWLQLVKNTGEFIRKNGQPDPVGDDFADIQEEISKVPTLIYDGPFSDHITERKPQELKGNNISKEEAQDKAKKVVDIHENVKAEISGGTSINGKIPSYNFQVKSKGQGIYSVDISKKGGYLVDLLNNRSVESARISQEEAVDKARDFLAVNGYPNMSPTYSETKGNVAYISFGYKQDKVIFYPDIINVQIALDNGQVLAVEALNYLMSHHTRKVEKPKITAEEARETASKTLEKIESVRLAVIPKSSLKEVLTYEVRGLSAGDTFIIFIDANTGDEEQVLKIIKGENGTFAL